MKRILIILISLIFVSSIANAYTQTPVIDGDSLYKFKVTPWKCVFTNENGSFTRYYTRQGVEKACGTVDSKSFVAMKQGNDKKDYYEQYRTYKNGETKLVRNWYNYGADYPKKRNDLKYQYNPSKNDKYGNWTYAKVNFRDEFIKREMIYYDESGYDAQEDALIDKRIKGLVEIVKEQENPLNISNLLASAYGIIARLLYIYGLFILFMLAFKRQKFYLWFDKKATKKITPWGNGLINKTFWCGLFPTLALMFPVAWYMYTGHTTAVIHMSLIEHSCIGLGIALIYCILYVLIRRSFCSKRCARWELVYSISIWLSIWAGIILSIYILVIALIALFFIGMLFGRGGSEMPTDENPDNLYATSWDTESAYLSRLSGNTYIDTTGNLYSVNNGCAHRLGDSKNFSF